MPILPEYSDDQIRQIAALPTPERKEGTWTLVAPDGTQYPAAAPHLCVAAELKARTPELIFLARLRLAMMDDAADDVPEGCKLVPLEPTVEQLNAARKEGFTRQLALKVYYTMLEAAPVCKK